MARSTFPSRVEKIVWPEDRGVERTSCTAFRYPLNAGSVAYWDDMFVWGVKPRRRDFWRVLLGIYKPQVWKEMRRYQVG